MIEKLISWFESRHLLVNFIFIGVIISGLIAWNKIGKEELPNVTFENFRIGVRWSGASPEDVDRFIIIPIEKEIKGLDDIESIKSIAQLGSASLNLSISADSEKLEDVVEDIKEVVNNVSLPSDVDDPTFRQFKTSKKAVIDLWFYFEGKSLFDDMSREQVQKRARALESQLISLPSVSGVNRSGFLQKNVSIWLNPDKLIKNGIAISEVSSAIKKNHSRTPAGTIRADWNKNEFTSKEKKQKERAFQEKDNNTKSKTIKILQNANFRGKREIRKIRKKSPEAKNIKVVINAEFQTIDELKNLVIRSDFEGNSILLKALGTVKKGFEEKKSIFKMNGCEAVRMTITKTSKTGIIEAIEEIKKKVKQFRKSNSKDKPIKIVLVDDESRDVKNRLSLVISNGAIGFGLILICLLLFLNWKAGFWVAMGLPFSLCFTLFFTWVFGYSINNITLSAIIVVLGMVVDDAIVVSENIVRYEEMGMNNREASIKGTKAVFLPIFASIITTCVAFVPLFFFGGRMGKMASFMPMVISLMLCGSLFESLFLLPAHMSNKIPKWSLVILSFGLLPLVQTLIAKKKKQKSSQSKHWFLKVEKNYEIFLIHLLNQKKWVAIGAVVMTLVTFYLFENKMKFQMFPREETTQFRLSGQIPTGANKITTSKMTQKVENIFKSYLGKEVIAYETRIAQSRRGNAARDNAFSIRIEITPKEKRKKSSSQLKKEWEEKIAKLEGFEKISFSRSWFGASSGSPIEILVQENNDNLRKILTEELYKEMLAYPHYTNSEIERELLDPEFTVTIDRNMASRLGISPSSIIELFRTIVNGSTLFEIPSDDDEDIPYILTVNPKEKNNIEKVLNIHIKNNSRYLVPIKQMVQVKTNMSANTLNRINYKRTSVVYADINSKGGKTPVETAEYFEENVFPKLLKKYPSSALIFKGEVEDTRKAGNEFKFTILIVIAMIYVILALVFNSLFKPLIIMITIPFGFVGVIFALFAHGNTVFGFFTVIGILGLSGVVINDAIVMLTKLDAQYDHSNKDLKKVRLQIASIGSSRLRAVLLTTITTVAGLFPTAYGILGFDSLLSDMMLAMAWGLLFGTLITLILIPCLYCFIKEYHLSMKNYFKFR